MGQRWRKMAQDGAEVGHEAMVTANLLRQFVDGARAAGIKPGIYYIVNNNILLSRVYNATPAQTEAVVLGQLREIWSGYGDLVELCACLAPLLRLRR